MRISVFGCLCVCSKYLEKNSKKYDDERIGKKDFIMFVLTRTNGDDQIHQTFIQQLIVLFFYIIYRRPMVDIM